MNTNFPEPGLEGQLFEFVGFPAGGHGKSRVDMDNGRAGHNAGGGVDHPPTEPGPLNIQHNNPLVCELPHKTQNVDGIGPRKMMEKDRGNHDIGTRRRKGRGAGRGQIRSKKRGPGKIPVGRHETVGTEIDSGKRNLIARAETNQAQKTAAAATEVGEAAGAATKKGVEGAPNVRIRAAESGNPVEAAQGTGVQFGVESRVVHNLRRKVPSGQP